MRKLLTKAFWLAICLTIAGGPEAAAQAVTARYAASPVDTVLKSAMVEELRALVNARVGASLQLTPTLPLSPNEISELFKRDALDVAILHTTALPPLARERAQVFNHAIAFASVDELRKALLSAVGASVLGALPENDLVGLGFLSTGLSRIATSNQQISSLNDLGGQKIIAPLSGTTRDVILRLGGNPTTIVAAELYTALERGSVDGAELTPGVGLTQQSYHEVFKTVVDQPFRGQVFVVVARTKFWRELPYSAQFGLSDAVGELADKLDEFARNSEVAFFSDVRSRGLRLVTPSAADTSRARSNSFAVWSEQAPQSVRDYLGRAMLAAAQQPIFLTPSSDKIAVDVMFATDRKDEGGAGTTSFGSRRAINQLTFAQASVTIPATAPLSTDLAKTAKIGTLSRYADSAAFVAAAKQKLAGTKSSRVLVHVHGYYNTLTDVLPRVAAFEHESKFDGVIVLYSWPSDGRALSYGYDHDSIEVSLQNFERFMGVLEMIVDRSRISVLLHSMGSRLWIDYIEKIKDRSGARRKYEHIAFAASDVSMDRFQQVADDLVVFARDVTVYSAENDNTLWLSEKLHAGDTRLGRPEHGKLFIRPPIQSIDATGVDASIASWRHSYVFNTPGGFRDVKLLLTQGMLAPRTGLVKRTRNADTYWYLTP